MENAGTFLQEVLTTLGNFVPKLAGVAALLGFTFWFAKWGGKRVYKSTKTYLDPTLAHFFGSVSRYAILAIGILGSLRIFGFETTSFAALIGAGGLAVGLAMQGTLSNFSAGVMLVLFRPFEVGDVVQVSGVTGKVAAISLFTTEFDTPDNRRILVPNGSIFGDTITNYNHHKERRVDVAVGTDYGSDIAQARDVMLAAASAVDGVLESPAPQVYLSELGGSSIDWTVKAWCKTPDYWAVKERVTQAIKNALDEAEIGIPFPQMDVHLDKVG
jgi:small conductance mechanosensitive channel